MSFLFKGKIISKSQYGFQPNKSCIDALIDFVKIMRTTMDSNLPGSALFVDLKKHLIKKGLSQLFLQT